MKRTNSFFVAAAIVAAMTFGLSSCNPDVQLGSQENIPEVAEHLLGMSVPEAMQYLEKQGFIFGSKADYANEYVFSRDASLTEFSYEATAMLMFGTFEGDTVRYADGMQCPKTEQAARDLYWKWSHYTAVVTLKEVERWDGDLVLKDLSGSSLKNKWMSYIDGSSAKQMLDGYRDKYELSTRRIDDMRDAIKFLLARHKLCLAIGDKNNAEEIKKKAIIWKDKMDADQKSGLSS